MYAEFIFLILLIIIVILLRKINSLKLFLNDKEIIIKILNKQLMELESED